MFIKRDEIYSKKALSNFYQSRLDTQITIKIFYIFFQPSIRMNGKSINFDDKKINKSTFYKNKKLFNIHDLDVNKILVSKKESYSTKDSLTYVIRPLYIKLPQMIGYAKDFDSNKIMSFKVSDSKLLKKYKKIWEKISNLMNIEFESEPVYGDGDKYINSKIKMYYTVNTNFQGKKVAKENASYKCLSLTVLGSVIRVNKKILSTNTFGRV